MILDSQRVLQLVANGQLPAAVAAYRIARLAARGADTPGDAALAADDAASPTPTLPATRPFSHSTPSSSGPMNS